MTSSRAGYGFQGVLHGWPGVASRPQRNAAVVLLHMLASCPAGVACLRRWQARCSFGSSVSAATRLCIQAHTYFKDRALLVSRAGRGRAAASTVAAASVSGSLQGQGGSASPSWSTDGLQHRAGSQAGTGALAKTHPLANNPAPPWLARRTNWCGGPPCGSTRSTPWSRSRRAC